jgi:hypothetical protein
MKTTEILSIKRNVIQIKKYNMLTQRNHAMELGNKILDSKGKRTLVKNQSIVSTF